jgi:hypothetical protein
MYRVFKETVGWSNALFIFDKSITFKEITHNTQTHFLSKRNYVGEFDFDNNFLKCFYKREINNKPFYYLYSYEEGDRNEFSEI